MRRLIALALLVISPALFAQAHGGLGSVPVSFGGGPAHVVSPPQRGIVIGGRGFRHHRHFRSQSFGPQVFWDGGWWWGDDGYSQVEQQPTQVGATPQPTRMIEEVKPAEPLLIEWQGDRFVRLTDAEANAAAGRPASRVTDYANPRPTKTSQAVSGDLPPALLIFRDGRRQEVSSYSIIDNAIYASASYWSAGFWTKKIELADLDLPATVKANQDRGVNFVLPSGPNQIVTRP